MVDSIKRYASVGIVLVTAVALIYFPVPWCFDCEGFGWGIVSDAVVDQRQTVLTCWLVSMSFLAGLFTIKRPWLVPFGVVVAHILTQHLGGVAWWSVRGNEGPVIFFIGMPVSFFALVMGCSCRFAFDWLRHRLHAESAAS
jgi:hypothetical protein